MDYEGFDNISQQGDYDPILGTGDPGGGRVLGSICPQLGCYRKGSELATVTVGWVPDRDRM